MKKNISPVLRIIFVLFAGLVLTRCRTSKPTVFTSFYDQLPLPDSIGFHKARYDSHGKVLPWMPWDKVLAMEMDWYDRHTDKIHNIIDAQVAIPDLGR